LSNPLSFGSAQTAAAKRYVQKPRPDKALICTKTQNGLHQDLMQAVLYQGVGDVSVLTFESILSLNYNAHRVASVRRFCFKL